MGEMLGGGLGGDFGAVYRRQRLQRAVSGDGVRAVLAAVVRGSGRAMCSVACRYWRSRRGRSSWIFSGTEVSRAFAGGC